MHSHAQICSAVYSLAQPSTFMHSHAHTCTAILRCTAMHSTPSSTTLNRSKLGYPLHDLSIIPCRGREHGTCPDGESSPRPLPRSTPPVPRASLRVAPAPPEGDPCPLTVLHPSMRAPYHRIARLACFGPFCGPAACLLWGRREFSEPRLEQMAMEASAPASCHHLCMVRDAADAT